MCSRHHWCSTHVSTSPQPPGALPTFQPSAPEFLSCRDFSSIFHHVAGQKCPHQWLVGRGVQIPQLPAFEACPILFSKVLQIDWAQWPTKTNELMTHPLWVVFSISLPYTLNRVSWDHLLNQLFSLLLGEPKSEKELLELEGNRETTHSYLILQMGNWDPGCNCFPKNAIIHDLFQHTPSL